MIFRDKWISALLAGGLVAAGSANAQDLSALEKRVQALEKAGGGQTVTRSKKSMSLTLSGFIDRAIQYRDNGTTSGVLHVTNDIGPTQIRWVGKGRINDDLTVTTLIELGNGSALSANQDLGDNGDADNASALDERHFDIQLTSKTFGKFSFGQGATATEDTSEVDLSGTGVITHNGDIDTIAGSEAFQLSNGTAQGRTVGNVLDNIDGAARRDRARYDTPKFAGFSIAASHHNADSWDAALHYGATIGGVKVAGALGYVDDTTRNSQKSVNGSVSVLLPIGLNFTAGAARRGRTLAVGSFDSDWRYGKIGYRFKGIDLGETRFAVEYSETDDLTAPGEEGSYFGVAVVQMVEPIGTELYLGYHSIDLDVAGTADPEGIDVVTVGARVKF